MNRSLILTTLLLLAGLAAATPGAAEPGRWTIRARGIATDYETQRVYGHGLGRNEIDLSKGSGLEIAAEVRSSPRLGWEFSIGQLSVDANYRDYTVFPTERLNFSSEGDFAFSSVGVAFLIHPLRDRLIDLYLGPQVAWVRYDVDVPGAPTPEPDPAYGAKLGAELGLGSSPWSLGLELRYLETAHKSVEHDLYGNFGISTAALGLAYRR